MNTSADFSQQIRTQIKLLDPSISLDPVTTERKIVDTVADNIAQAQIDQYVIQYQFDIDSKVGSDLEKFVALFGFARRGGTSATGIVTFYRNTPALDDLVIFAGTQCKKPTDVINPTIIFATTATVVLARGNYTVDAPIQSVLPGTLGNVPANTIISIGTTSSSVTNVVNNNATSNGKDLETDAELRIRFKNTVFRNIAGTRDQYLALAIASQFATKANVIGPISRYIEYLQIVSGNTTSLVPYSKYTYPFDYFLTDGGISGENFFNPSGVDFTFNTTIPPTITVNNANTLPVGTVVLLEHSYCSSNSRNDPANNIANYVDVFVAGESTESVAISALFPDSGNNFVNNSNSKFHTGKFVRPNTLVAPTVGNRFQELLWQPLLTLPSTINVNGTDYFENVDYWMVKDTTVYKGSKRARDGIEWSAAAATAISAGTSLVVLYDINRLPIILNELINAHKQVTSDVLVHAATKRYFNVNLTVMYAAGTSKAAVDTSITAALINYFNTQTFGTVIQLSDILEAVHEVSGVDNVRFTTIGDGGSEVGIQEVAGDGVTLINQPYQVDFTIQDSELPVLNLAIITQKSQNTW